MATYKAVILQGKNDTKADGTTNIKIRITHKGKINYISTDLYILPSQMNNKSGLVESGNNISFINLSITSWLHRCRKIDIELDSMKYLMSVSDIKNRILSANTNHENLDFFVFANKIASNTHTESTANNYKSLISRLETFVGPILPFREINLSFLQRFERYLYNNGARNGITNYMVTFRSIFNKARDEYNNEQLGDFPIPHYPFRKYKIPKRIPHTKEHVLTDQELLKFMSYQPVNSGEEFAKDMFMLMIYLIGIEAKDLFFLSKDKNGRISYQRFKTKGNFSIRIEPVAQQIINKYEGTNSLLKFSELFKHHKSFYRKINNYLHGSKSAKITGIFERLGIPKKVTTKWARHTWATIARNDCRIDKDNVALCLGHKDIDNRVTDMYIKYDYSIIDECNQKVIDFIHNLK